ncbi:hypothetical protein AC629_33365 [Bradyrhizobium sp. NAS80.1]|nr:hypothetical protein AC629_33365 [Bradyrhizobium sp. NAS80.1]
MGGRGEVMARHVARCRDHANEPVKVEDERFRFNRVDLLLGKVRLFFSHQVTIGDSRAALANAARWYVSRASRL